MRGSGDGARSAGAAEGRRLLRRGRLARTSTAQCRRHLGRLQPSVSAASQGFQRAPGPATRTAHRDRGGGGKAAVGAADVLIPWGRRAKRLLMSPPSPYDGATSPEDRGG